MSYFSHAFQKIFVGDGTLLTDTSKSTVNLTAGQLGLFAFDTFKALPVVGANPNPKKMFLIAQGSYHAVDSLSPFFGGLQESVKSRGINPAFIEKFYKVLPTDAVADVWTIGYDGVTSTCNCITAKCENKYSIRIDVKGDSVSRLYNRNLYRVISVDTPCCDEGCDNCTDGVVDPKWVAEQIAAKVNADPELKNFVRAEVMYSVMPTFSATDIVTHTVTKTDAGDGTALTAIQSAYANETTPTVRVSYAGGVSTYTVVQAGTATFPEVGDAFTPDSVTPVSILYSRELCLTVTGTEDISATIDDLYDGRTDLGVVAVKTTGTSAITYSVVQYAEAAVTMTADYIGTPTYENVPSYEGFVWGECPCVTEPAAYTGCAGVRLTAAYEDTVFGNCSFQPRDYYNVQPLKIYVSKVDDAELCTDDHMDWTVRQQSIGKQASGLGETFLREYILQMGYKQEYFEHDPRFREVMDQQHLNVIDRTKKYKAYYLIHSIPNWVKGMNVKSYDEKYVLCFLFESTVNTAAFESLLEGYTLAVAGVALETI